MNKKMQNFPPEKVEIKFFFLAPPPPLNKLYVKKRYKESREGRIDREHIISLYYYKSIGFSITILTITIFIQLTLIISNTFKSNFRITHIIYIWVFRPSTVTSFRLIQINFSGPKRFDITRVDCIFIYKYIYK